MSLTLIIASVFFVIAMLIVPIFQQYKLGSVLGFLAGGMIVGIILHGLGHAIDAIEPIAIIQNIAHISEFGVVIMLFIIGLEMRPRHLWKLRHDIFGIGGLQIILSALALSSITYFAGLEYKPALCLGLILSLSSTAIIIQSLNEKNLIKSTGGQKCFSVLLMQDISVIPIIALIPLLAPKIINQAFQASSEHAFIDILSFFPQGSRPFLILGSIALVFFVSKYLTEPLFRSVAKAKLPELFTIAALGLVTSIAMIMTLMGLSPALGVFISGVILSDSDFRHELESNLGPFKGILLGIFFMTVGAGFDFRTFLIYPIQIVLATVLLVFIKFGAVWIISSLFKLPSKDKLLASLALAQGGEFAFVLLEEAMSESVFTHTQTSFIKIVVAISMALTPFLFIYYEKKFSKINQDLEDNKNKKFEPIDEENNIIVAGFGRFGQIVVRLLASCGYKSTVLDNDPEQIELLKKFGRKIYFGDASRPEVLRSAGIANANILVLAIDNSDAALEISKWVKANYPNVKILARVRNRGDYHKFLDVPVSYIFRETFETALSMGAKALELIGYHPYQAQRAIYHFERSDKNTLEKLHNIRGQEELYIDSMAQAKEELSKVLLEELGKDKNHISHDMEWDDESGPE